MFTEENKELVRRWVEEVWNGRDIDAVDRFVTVDYTRYDPSGPAIHGPEGERQLVEMYISAFPDLHFTIEDMVAEGDKIATRKTATGTHQGELLGMPPTGSSIRVTTMEIYRMEAGKIAEQWVLVDNLGMLQQLGVAG